MVTLIQIYKEKEKVGQKRNTKCTHKEKKSIRKRDVGVSPVLKEVKTDLMLNGMEGVVPSG